MKKYIVMLATVLVIGAISFAVGVKYGTQNNSKKATTYHNECPMCHSNVKLMVRQYTCGNDYMIECLNDDCGMHTGYFKDKEELVEKWNKMFKTLNERKGEEK